MFAAGNGRRVSFARRYSTVLLPHVFSGKSQRQDRRDARRPDRVREHHPQWITDNLGKPEIPGFGKMIHFGLLPVE